MTLFEFAFCGNKEHYSNALARLRNMAEPDTWSFDTSNPTDILYGYINDTFKQCYAQNKILYSEDGYACFNTGLLTPNTVDIVMYFNKNSNEDKQEWYFLGFIDVTSWEFMNHFPYTPKLATYINSPEELQFHPEYKIVLNIDHIIDENWERVHSVIPFPKSVAKKLLDACVSDSIRKIERNMNLVLPQFYKNKIMYLVPVYIPISDTETRTMALAVELMEFQKYRANTIFTKEIAYGKARLLMRLENNWLL